MISIYILYLDHMKMITDNKLCMMTSKFDFQYQLNPSFSVKFVEEITHKTI